MNMNGYYLSEYNDEIMDKLFNIVSDNLVYFVGQKMANEYNRQAFKKSKSDNFKPIVYVEDNDTIIGFIEVYMKDNDLIISKAEVRQEYVGNSKMHKAFEKAINQVIKNSKFDNIKVFINNKHEKVKREYLSYMKSYEEGVNTVVCYLDLDNKAVKKFINKD